MWNHHICHYRQIHLQIHHPLRTLHHHPDITVHFAPYHGIHFLASQVQLWGRFQNQFDYIRLPKSETMMNHKGNETGPYINRHTIAM